MWLTKTSDDIETPKEIDELRRNNHLNKRAIIALGFKKITLPYFCVAWVFHRNLRFSSISETIHDAVSFYDVSFGHPVMEPLQQTGSSFAAMSESIMDT